jgi:hypothetical protein
MADEDSRHPVQIIRLLHDRRKTDINKETRKEERSNAEVGTMNDEVGTRQR